jgi:nucleoid-associated protein YgaU
MKKDAKIGLAIVLGAVLLSALLIGKALKGPEARPVKIPDEAGSPQPPGASELSGEDGTVDNAPPSEDGGETEVPEGGAMGRLTGGTSSSGQPSPGGSEGSAGTAGSGHGSLADSGGTAPPAGTGSTGSDTFGLAGNVRTDSGDSGSAGTGGDSSGVTEKGSGGSPPASNSSSTGGTEEFGGWAGPSGESGTSSSGASEASGSSGRTGGSGTTGSSDAGGSSSVTTTGTTTTSTTTGETPAAGSDFTYTVQEGDSAWKLSKRFYGSGVHWRKIVMANRGVNFGNLKVGTKLTIPGKVTGGTSATAGTASSAAASETGSGELRTHRVARGDSLYRIAEKYLGSGMRYREIAKLNPGVDAGNLKIGQTLKIPAR